MRMALASLFSGGEAIDINGKETSFGRIVSDRYAFDKSLDIDSAGLTEDEVAELQPLVYKKFSNLFGRTYWKVHDAWGALPSGEILFPQDITELTIYIIRDPRDVVLSYANYFSCDVDEAIRHMANPGHVLARRSAKLARQIPQRLSSWSGHVASWTETSDLPTLVVRYEDMFHGLGGILKTICQRLDLDYDDTAIAGAIEHSRFEALKSQEMANGFKEKMSKSISFFSQGKTGTWRERLTPEQVLRIERDHGAMMAKFGYAGT
nr:sulfotransferase domain-containing protein [Nitrospirillum amazonense]